MRYTIMEKIILLFALSRGLCYFSGEGWHFDGGECAIANSRGDSSSTKVRNARHPRGTCGNAAWRLHYFWGEKCPFLLEDSSPRATRARLVKILRTAYKLDREPTLLFLSSPSRPLLYLLLYSSSYCIYNLANYYSERAWEIGVMIRCAR